MQTFNSIKHDEVSYFEFKVDDKDFKLPLIGFLPTEDVMQLSRSQEKPEESAVVIDKYAPGLTSLVSAETYASIIEAWVSAGDGKKS